MEDRNPFLPTESEFKVPQSEELEESDKKETKKKKSKFAELLAKLFPNKNEEKIEFLAESEQKQGFLEKIAGRFGFLGIEKEEILETSDEVRDRESANPGILYAPLGLDIDSLAPHDDNELSRDSLDETHHNEKNAIEVTEQPQDFHELPLVDEGATEISSPEEVRQYTIPQDEIMSKYESQDTENTQTEALSTIPASAEVAEHAKREQDKEMVIEKGGGGGAALLGFVAAETLSRSRDKKIRKEAAELKQQVQKLEQKQAVTDYTLETTRQKNKDQLNELRLRRVEAPEVTHSEKTVIDTANVKNAPVRLETVSQTQKKAEQHPTRTLVTPERVSSEEKWARESHDTEKQSEKRFVLDQIEKAADQDIALEAFYEKRHEVKDVPTSANHSSASGAVSNRESGDTVSARQGNAFQLPSEISQSQNKITTAQSSKQTLYADAMKGGVIAGLAIILAFVLIALVWNLF